MPSRKHPLAIFSLVAVAACSGGASSSVIEAPVDAHPTSDCAEGTVWDGARCAAKATPVPSEEAVEETSDEGAKKADPAPVVVPTLDAAVFRDDRRRPLRALALVVTEVQQLEMLFRATSLAATDRPMLLRRLAEDYVEIEKQALARSSPPGKRLVVVARETTAERARQRAIADYTALLTDYSGLPSTNFPSAPPPAAAQLDEVRYYLALEHERQGDLADARREYLDVITKTPGSRLVPRVYLAFGEMFFDEATSDPSKWELAKAAYTKVLATPPPANDVYGYACYKLAHVLLKLGDRTQAVEAFRKVIAFATTFPVPGAATLGAEAQEQMTAVSP